MTRRTVLRGGYVLTFDSELGELPSGDVLIEDDRIVAVARALGAGDAEVVDVRGHVVMPGFVDTHRHTRQTAFRGVAADWTHEQYVRAIRLKISPACGPEDLYAGTLLGALEALDAGVTTLLDFCHSIATPDHADEALRGLRQAGCRAVFAYGYHAVASPKNGFADNAARLADARRIRAQQLASDDGLVRMGVAFAELGLVPFEESMAQVRSAREMGVPAALHTGGVWGSPVSQGLRELDHHGLLGPEQVHIHCNSLTPRDLRRLADHDCKISSSPETEMQMGMGHPIIGRAIDAGIRPSLSCDTTSCNSGDLFGQMRIALQAERCRHNDGYNGRHEMPPALRFGVRDALRWATVNGAHALGMESRIGTLTPGKQADVVVIGGRRLNVSPMADPVGCLVAQATAANVEHVLVAGRFAKRNGRMVSADVDRAIELARESADRILRRIDLASDLAANEKLTEIISVAATRNLARAWTLPPAAE